MSTSLNVPHNRAVPLGELTQAIETSLADALTLRPRVDLKIGRRRVFHHSNG